nr:hypothetical protein B0A51_01796 [Rachicladosporium sp. CCFEE 5018]
MATQKAEWAASVVDWAAKLAAEQSETKIAEIVASEPQADPQNLPARPFLQPLTAAEKVFAVTELTEAILAHDIISIRQLFLLQRVNRQFADTIAGSIRLRKKLWLHPLPMKFDGKDALNPLLGDEKQRFQIFDNTSFCNELIGSYRGKLYDMQLCWSSDASGNGKQGVQAMLMAFAAGTAIKSGSWENMLIYQSATETDCCLNQQLVFDAETSRSTDCGTTLGEWMRGLAVLSMWDLQDHFAEITKVIEGVKFKVGA